MEFFALPGPPFKALTLRGLRETNDRNVESSGPAVRTGS
ncbi:hypothetical protein J2T18_002476 [Paenibacillus polymyxa]|nr:hypothetical protein [Paenibacillus polymyxa]